MTPAKRGQFVSAKGGQLYRFFHGVENVNSMEFSQIIQNLAKFSDDAELLKKVVLWSETFSKTGYKLSSTYLSVARIYKKFGNIDAAKEWADKALKDEQSKTYPQVSEINRFINELNQDVKKE